MQHFKKLSKITYVVSLGFCVYKSHLECQSLEIILDANRFANGRASRFG